VTDITAIAAQLNAEKTLISQVLTLTPGGFDLPALTAIELGGLLDDIYGAQTYMVRLPENATHPSAVYTLTGVDSFEFDGFRITQTDIYRITARASTYATLDANIRSIITTLRSSAYSAEPFDMATRYDDEQRVFVADIDVEFTYINDGGGGPAGNNAAELPVALVYPIGRSAQDSQADNLIKQIVTDNYGIILVTADSNVPALMAEVSAALLGFSQGGAYFDMQYQNGSNLGGVADMELWREVYADQHAITEA